MPQINTCQSMAKEEDVNQHGASATTDEAEGQPQVLRLVRTEMATAKQFVDAHRRDAEENADFYSNSQTKELGAASKKAEEATPNIFSRQQRSQSVGSSNTCYVVHDAEGKPVLRLISSGFAISRKIGEATILQESAQSATSSWNMSKESSVLQDHEEIVLMLGDSINGTRTSMKIIHMGKEAVDRKVEQSRPVQMKEVSARRRRKKRPTRPDYSTDNQEFDGDQSSLRRTSRRERKGSKDSCDSFEERGSRTKPSRKSLNEYRAERGFQHHKNRNIASRSQMYERKSEEFLPHRTSINRSAKYAGGKDSSALTSYEETSQDPHTSASLEIGQETIAQSETPSVKEETLTDDETQVTPTKKGAKGGKKGKKGGAKEKASDGDSTSVASVKKKKKGAGSVNEEDKGEKASSLNASVADEQISVAAEPVNETSPAAPQSEATEEAEGKPGKDKKKKKQKKGAPKVSEGELSVDESAAVVTEPTVEPVSETTEGEPTDEGMALGQQIQEEPVEEKAEKKGKSKKSKTSVQADSEVASVATLEGHTSTPSLGTQKSIPMSVGSVEGSQFKTGMNGDEDDAGSTTKSKKRSSVSELATSEVSDPGDLKRAYSAAKEKATKEKKDRKKGKGSRESSKDMESVLERKSSADSGMVHGLQVTETPQEQISSGQTSLFQIPEESPYVRTPTPSLVGSQRSQRDARSVSDVKDAESLMPEPPEPTPEQPPPSGTESEVEVEDLGTIVYQHVARYICIGLLRVAGGVRVLFDGPERQAYVQVISPLCEAYVTYYVNNMTFLTSTSAAGVAWAALIHRKKNGEKNKEATDSGNEKPKKEKDRYSEQELAKRLERCKNPEGCKCIVDTAHVVFCDPFQAQRFRIVLETLKSAAECSNSLITPCIPSGSPISFPCPPCVPCAIVDPLNIQRPCPPPLPPACCYVPFCPPSQSQQPSQSMPFGTNPCLGSQMGQFQDYCSQQQNMFPSQCSDVVTNPQPFANRRPTPTPTQPDYNPHSVTPSPMARSPNTPTWGSYTSKQQSSYPTPYVTQSNTQQPQMHFGNEMVSQPPSPYPYSPHPDQGMDRGQTRFNPNATVLQSQTQMSRPEDTMKPDCYANIAANQMECYDPYSYENCCAKTLFCAPACLVRLNNDMVWTDLHKGCLKIFQCPNNAGYSLVLENMEKAITIHHYLTADTFFIPSENTQFGFTYTTVTRSENRGSLVEHFLVSFMNCRSAEQFKGCMDNIKAVLQNSSDDWTGVQCPSKSLKSWQGYNS